MLLSPQAPVSPRAPRTSFAESTPAVLRCQDGRRVPGKLQVISVTGGLLQLARPLDQGTSVKLMFLTGGGSVLGAAEMLCPISWRLQPFKFVRLYNDDKHRLQCAIRSSLNRSREEHGQVEQFRAW